MANFKKFGGSSSSENKSRPEGQSRPRKTNPDSPKSFDKKSAKPFERSERAPFRKTDGEQDPKKSYRPRATDGNSSRGGERSAPYKGPRNSDSPRPDRERGGFDRKPAPGRSFDGKDKKSFDKPYGKPDRREGSNDKPFRKADGFDRKPAPRFSEGSGKSYDKPYGKPDFDKSDRKPAPRRDFDKPYAKKSFDKSSIDRSSDRNRDTRGYDKPKFEDKPRPAFKKIGNNDRQVGLSQPPRYDVEGLKKKAAPRVREKIQGGEETEIRLNRYIANAGLCSRREADDLIASGMIKVNGKVITEMGYQVKPGDTVKYGKDVLSRERMMYILLNKPKDFITTMDDPDDRRTVLDLIQGACKERVYPVGRLDRNTTGLLLLTNDGELTDKLTHPSNAMRKVYQAELDKPMSEEDFLKLKDGLELEDGFVKPDDVGYVTPDRYVIGLEIHSGKNRIVRRMFEHLGYEVTKLDRTIFAGLTKKDLPRGKWRFLTEKEVITLKYLL